MLECLGVARASEYRTHDFRRGHAKDLQISGEMRLFCAGCCSCAVGAAGAPLWAILQAGEWRSPAFLKYLDLHKLDMDLVMQAHVDEESDSD